MMTNTRLKWLNIRLKLTFKVQPYLPWQFRQNKILPRQCLKCLCCYSSPPWDYEMSTEINLHSWIELL